MLRNTLLSLPVVFHAANVFALSPPQGGEQNPYSIFILMGALFVIMYLFVIRPQQKKVKQHKALVESLKKGDEVILNSGMFGKIVKVGGGEKKHIQVEIADKVTVKVLKDSIAEVLGKGGVSEADKKPKADKKDKNNKDGEGKNDGSEKSSNTKEAPSSEDKK